MAFIAFEGLDGSGKSTLMKLLSAELDKNKIKFELTREPGGTPLGDDLRNLIVNPGIKAPTPRAELLLYEASRAQLVEKIIKPLLQQKTWVLTDRFAASSIAFQAGGRSISKSKVEWLNEFATDGVEPDLYILLDISVEESKNRRLKRQNETGEEQDRIESEQDDFHQRVRNEFIELAKKDNQRWLVLRASESSQEMLEKVIQKLKEKGWLS